MSSRKQHQFSQTSLNRLQTCHEDLQILMKEVIKTCPVDFGIAEGHRTIERQLLLYDEGKTHRDGIYVKSKHNYKPSQAVDIYGWVEGQISYSDDVLCFLGGYILATAEKLLEERKMRFRIRWGGNWDGDGIIKADQRLIDLPHFEILCR